MSTIVRVVVPEIPSPARQCTEALAGEISDEMAEIVVAELKKRFFADNSATDHIICEECLANCLREKSELPRMAKAIALSALTHTNARFLNNWTQNVLDEFLKSRNRNNDEIKAVAAKLN